jgi:hypothetical protein
MDFPAASMARSMRRPCRLCRPLAIGLLFISFLLLSAWFLSGSPAMPATAGHARPALAELVLRALHYVGKPEAADMSLRESAEIYRARLNAALVLAGIAVSLVIYLCWCCLRPFKRFR